MSASKWRELVEQKAIRGKLWAPCGIEQLVRRVRERFAIKKALARSVLADAENARQQGTDADGNTRRRTRRSSSFLRHSTDLCCGDWQMRQAHIAVKSVDWANYLEVFSGNDKLSAWTSAKVKE